MNLVKDDKLVDDSIGNNNLSQNMSYLKKVINLAKLKKLKNYSKLSKSKKTILNKFEILINFTVAIYANATGYLIIKARVIFTYLKQIFIKHQSSDTLIRNIISKLKLMLLIML